MDLKELTNKINTLCPNTNSVEQKESQWNFFLNLEPTPYFQACECCVWHPLTEKMVEDITCFLTKLKGLGCEPPDSISILCEDEVFIDWWSDGPLFTHHINVDSDGEAMITTGKPFPHNVEFFKLEL